MVTILYQAKALSDQKECEIGRFKGKHIRVYNLCNKDEKWWKRQVAEFGDKLVYILRKYRKSESSYAVPPLFPLYARKYLYTRN